MKSLWFVVNHNFITKNCLLCHSHIIKKNSIIYCIFIFYTNFSFVSLLFVIKLQSQMFLVTKLNCFLDGMLVWAIIAIWLHTSMSSSNKTVKSIKLLINHLEIQLILCTFCTFARTYRKTLSKIKTKLVQK